MRSIWLLLSMTDMKACERRLRNRLAGDVNHDLFCWWFQSYEMVKAINAPGMQLMTPSGFRAGMPILFVMSEHFQFDEAINMSVRSEVAPWLLIR